MIKAGFCLPSNVIFVLAVIFSFFIAKILFNLTKNIGHITGENSKMMCPTFVLLNLQVNPEKANYLLASSIATATATVIPTMGLLPAPMRPIIST